MDKQESAKTAKIFTIGEAENLKMKGENKLPPCEKNGRDAIKSKEGSTHQGEISPEGAGEDLAPPDGGWGWLVAFGAFVITSLLPLLGPCFGILFSKYLLSLGTSSTVTAWIFNTQCFMWNISGLMTRPFTQEFGWRSVGIVGAFLTSVSLVISAFAPTAEFLFFSFSLLSGTGGGAVVCICFTIVPLYFDRKRGSANAIMMAGVCMGQIIGPPLVNFLQEEYGYRGATVLMGAIILNGCVGASFFHPIEWHQKKKPRENTIPQLPSPTEEPLLSRRRRTSSEALDNPYIISMANPNENTSSPILAVRRGIMRVRNHSLASLGGSSLGLSTIDLSGITALASGADDDDEEEESSQKDARSSSNFLQILGRVWSSTWSDLCALKNPRALIIAIGGTLCINGYLNFVMMVPFAMQAGGYTLEDSAYCISISAICNLKLRIMVSFLSDWKWFNIRGCYMFGFGVISVTMFVFPALTDLRWMMIVMAIWGCGVGANMGVYNLVMIKVMGIEQLPAVFGSCCFMVAIGFIILGPSIGFVRDMTGSYKISMWVLATMVFLSLCLWIIMPAPKGDQAAEEEEEEDEEVAKKA